MSAFQEGWYSQSASGPKIDKTHTRTMTREAAGSLVASYSVHVRKEPERAQRGVVERERAPGLRDIVKR